MPGPPPLWCVCGAVRRNGDERVSCPGGRCPRCPSPGIIAIREKREAQREQRKCRIPNTCEYRMTTVALRKEVNSLKEENKDLKEQLATLQIEAVERFFSQ